MDDDDDAEEDDVAHRFRFEQTEENPEKQKRRRLVRNRKGYFPR